MLTQGLHLAALSAGHGTCKTSSKYCNVRLFTALWVGCMDGLNVCIFDGVGDCNPIVNTFTATLHMKGLAVLVSGQCFVYTVAHFQSECSFAFLSERSLLKRDWSSANTRRFPTG